MPPTESVAQNWNLINIPVELRELAFPTTAPNIIDSPELDKVPNRKAVVRTDTNQVLNIVSSDYKLVPHAEVFKPIAEALEELDLKVVKTKASVANSGAYARYSFVLDLSDEINSGDKVNLVVTARNSYNYESIMFLSAEALRQICANGAMAPIPGLGRGSAAGGRHTRNLDVAAAIAQIRNFTQRAPDMFQTWREWSAIECDPGALGDFLAEQELVSKKATEEILGYYASQPDHRNSNFTQNRFNLWEAYNAITWFATHRVKSKSDRAAVTQDAIHRLAVKFATRFSKN